MWASFLGLAPERCHLVEACPVNHGLLGQRFPGAKTYNYGISDHDGTISLYVIDKPSDEGTSRSNTTDPAVLKAKSAITLSHLLDLAKIDRCDLLHINCEGSEYDILGGDVTFLDRVSLLELDLHEGLFQGARTHSQTVEKRVAIYDLLEGRGFVRLGGHGRKHLSSATQHLSSFWEKASDIPARGALAMIHEPRPSA